MTNLKIAVGKETAEAETVAAAMTMPVSARGDRPGRFPPEVARAMAAVISECLWGMGFPSEFRHNEKSDISRYTRLQGGLFRKFAAAPSPGRRSYQWRGLASITRMRNLSLHLLKPPFWPFRQTSSEGVHNLGGHHCPFFPGAMIRRRNGRRRHRWLVLDASGDNPD